MSAKKGIQALENLGLTHLEAEIYAFLVKNSPATGYRVAKGIEKPVANTYKAIQSLAQKGGALVEEGTARQCWAVPPSEFLGQLEREVHASRIQAEKALVTQTMGAIDDREYPIGGWAALVWRLRQMLGEAESVVLAVLPFHLASELEASLTAAIGRQVEVLLRSAPLPILNSMDQSGLTTFAQANDVRMVVDGVQYCVACVDAETLVTGIWCRNPHLALGLHAGLAAEFCLASLAEKIEDDAGQKRLLKTLSQLKLASSTPGFGRAYRVAEPPPPPV